ncbi:MAG: dTMP kinase [Candidatus Aminicenantes bacterium]|nr:dTMP kinase [Candidatus Aminicenantes bacterium]
MRLKKGVLIVFEGIDGSGKSTQVALLLDALAKKGISAVSFREPSDSRWGKEIKKKAVEAGSLRPEEELNLFQRDRKENVEKNLMPSLSEKKIVVLDRYYYSTMAYQGAKGINIEDIRKNNEKFAPLADLVFVLDVDEKLGLKRISNRKVKDIHFEEKKYLSQVRENFLNIKGKNIIHIDGTQPAEVIHKRIMAMVTEYIKTQNSKLKAQN